MSKFNSNLLKIKLFYFSLIGKIKNNNHKINTSSTKLNTEKVLIIFPFEQTEFDVAKYSFRKLSLDSKNKYIFLINNVFHSSTQLRGTTYGYNYFKSSEKIIINNDFYNDNIITNGVDAIIDLNFTFNLDLALIIDKIKSNYKICLKNNYSDFFFNIQFDGETLESGYSRINSMLN